MARISVVVLFACIIAMGASASASAYVGAKGTYDTYATNACLQGSCPPQGYMGGPPPPMNPQYGAPVYGAPVPYPRRITKCKPPAKCASPQAVYPQGPAPCPPPGCSPAAFGPGNYAVPACGPMGCPSPYKPPVRWY